MRSTFVLVSAPAGFGKTTAVSMWARSLESGCAWLTLDAGDNDPIRFFTYVLAALRHIDDTLGTTVQAALRAPQLPPTETLMTEFINNIAARDTDVILVLDDYHLITAAVIHEALTFLLDNAPPQMHLVLITRADPPLPLSRWRAGGHMTEIRAAHLRFTLEEATTFFNMLMGLNVPGAQISALAARTEGWVTGLQLAALSMQGHGAEDIATFVEGFTGSNRYILDYLTDEVLRQRPAGTRTFLLHTSILDRLCGPLCDAITGQAGSQETLEQLDATNLFLVPLDDARHWYRYHQLFADLLRQRLYREQPDAASALHYRAAQWYEQHGYVAEAVHHALAGEHWDHAIALIEGNVEAMLKRGEVATALGWFHKLPDDEIRRRPQLCYAYSWPLILTGQIDVADAYLERAEAGIHTERDRKLHSEITAAQAYIARVRGDNERTIALSQRALARMQADDVLLRSVLAMNLGIAHWHTGNLPEAEAVLHEAVEAAATAGNTYSRLTALSYLGGIHVARGMLHAAAYVYRRALRYGEDSPATANARINLGALLYEWNDLGTATEHVEQGLALSRRSGNVETQIGGYTVLARIKQATGDAAAAAAMLEQAQQLCYEHKVTPAAHAQTAACGVELALSRGDLTRALQWSKAVPMHTDTAPLYALPALVPARLHLAHGRHAVAAQQLEGWYARAAEANWGFAMVKIRILQALAAPTTEDAVGFMTDALRMGQPEGYIRAFVDEGAAAAGLLQHVAARGIAVEYFRVLLAGFDGELPAAQDEATMIETRRHSPSFHAATLVEPLSDREVEVIHLLANGQTYQEMARTLCISINTVKTHLQNIYGKLGVHNRRDAVTTARAVGLLS